MTDITTGADFATSLARRVEINRRLREAWEAAMNWLTK
jgi:hypothetical protein